MFSSVLIANRGEIAVRIARSARRLGMRTVAVYSAADAGALHVRACDEACPIGPAEARASYLSIEQLIEAARRTGVDCVHPGYGFLAENPDFAEACAAAGFVFVGPPPAAIRAMGLKDRAKALMEKAGVPVVPGFHGERQEAAFLREKAYQIGYPVLIKPVAGGGGKGMRRVDKHAEFVDALAGAQREAASAFGDPRVLIERYVDTPRHIEVQVFADGAGHTIHLGERDCSLQRRHQKVVEEAPAPGMTAELRAVIGAAAVEAARAVGYAGAGTVEFIADGSAGLRADAFWFLEMNTRLQVEHPVTEAVTGLDLVEWQFRVAAGEDLPLTQDKVSIAGHAVEARLYAEDPDHGFLPSTGRIVALEWPGGEGVRIDAGVDAASTVTPYYDPLLAKLIAHGTTREDALDRLAAAVERTVVAGPRTNAGFLAALVRAEDFRAGRFDTGFIGRNLATLCPEAGLDRAAAAAGVARLIAREQARLAAASRSPDGIPSPWDATDGFELAGPRVTALPVVVDGTPMMASAAYGHDGAQVSLDTVAAATDVRMVDADDAVHVLRHGRQTVVTPAGRAPIDVDHLDTGGLVLAPMHGKVLEVLVEEGAAVHRGQRLAVIEAMKMEHALLAPADGVVTAVAIRAGEQVNERARVMVIEPSTA